MQQCKKVPLDIALQLMDIGIILLVVFMVAGFWDLNAFHQHKIKVLPYISKSKTNLLVISEHVNCLPFKSPV